MTIDTSVFLSDLHRLITLGLGGWIAFFHLKEQNKKEVILDYERRISSLEKQALLRPEHDEFSKNMDRTISRIESLVKETFMRMEKNMDRLELNMTRQEESLTEAIKEAMVSLRHEFGARS